MDTWAFTLRAVNIMHIVLHGFGIMGDGLTVSLTILMETDQTIGFAIFAMSP